MIDADIIGRLRRIAHQLRNNDASLVHFEPLPPQQQQQQHQSEKSSQNDEKRQQLSTKNQEQHERQLKNQQCRFRYHKIVQKYNENETDMSRSSTRCNYDCDSFSLPLSLHLTSFSLFENEEFQFAFRDCLQALYEEDERKHVLDDDHRAGIDHRGYSSPFWRDFTHSTAFHENGSTEFAVAKNYNRKRSFIRRKRRNPYVTKVTLRALPEPDLRLALYAISNIENLEDLQILDCPQSQCIAIQDVTDLLVSLYRTNVTRKKSRSSRKGLCRLNISTRIQVRTQRQLDDLAIALGWHCSTLEYVSLHLIPRCSSIERPDMNLNSVMNAFCNKKKLKLFRLVLGYDHNPFGKPLITPGTLRRFLSDNTKLQQLQLDNFGFTDHHFRVVAGVLRTKSKMSELRELQFARNHRNYQNWSHQSQYSRKVFTSDAIQNLCRVLETENYNVTKLCLLTDDEIQRCQDFIDLQESSTGGDITHNSHLDSFVEGQRMLNVYTRLNQLNRKELFERDSEDVGPWLEALSLASTPTALLCSQKTQNEDEIEALSATYTLLRSNPAILLSGWSSNQSRTANSARLKSKKVPVFERNSGTDSKSTEYNNIENPKASVYPVLSTASMFKGICSSFELLAHTPHSTQTQCKTSTIGLFKNDYLASDYTNETPSSALAKDSDLMERLSVTKEPRRSPPRRISGWFQKLGSRRNRKLLEFRKPVNSLSSDPDKVVSDAIDSFDDTDDTNMDDDTDSFCYKVSVAELEDDDSIVRYKNLRRITRKRSSESRILGKKNSGSWSCRLLGGGGGGGSSTDDTTPLVVALPPLIITRSEVHPHRLRYSYSAMLPGEM